MDAEREKILVEKAKNDRQAFGQLYDEYYDTIFGYILTRTSNLQVSQDITSNTFVKALNAIKRFNWHGIPFSVWLCRIANHEIANHYRQNGHGMIMVDKITETITLNTQTPESEIEAAEEELRKRKTYLALHNTLSRLPLRYQEVLVLRFFEDKKIDEIGSILGQNQGMVKHLLYRGLAKLQTMLQQGEETCQDKNLSLKEA